MKKTIKTTEKKMWVLLNKEGKAIWIGRFKPLKQVLRNQGTFFWCDVNGTGPIEGSLNATCKLLSFSLLLV